MQWEIHVFGRATLVPVTLTLAHVARYCVVVVLTLAADYPQSSLISEGKLVHGILELNIAFYKPLESQGLINSFSD